MWACDFTEHSEMFPIFYQAHHFLQFSPSWYTLSFFFSCCLLTLVFQGGKTKKEECFHRSDDNGKPPHKHTVNQSQDRREGYRTLSPGCRKPVFPRTVQRDQSTCFSRHAECHNHCSLLFHTEHSLLSTILQHPTQNPLQTHLLYQFYIAQTIFQTFSDQ